MKQKRLLQVGLVLGITMGCGALPAAETETTVDEHAAHATAVGELALQLDHGKRWATDEPLRTGMTAIRTAFEANHDAYHDHRMTAAEAGTLADQVDVAIRGIIATCKLPPAADAELHKVLAAALGAVNTLRGAEFEPGMPRLHEALLAYGEYFDHWEE